MTAPGQARNLIIIADPDAVDIGDFAEVGRRVARLDPAIQVFLGTPRDSGELVPAHRWQFPSLTVAIGGLGQFKPTRGKVYYNRQLSKWRQYELLRKASIAVPRTVLFEPGIDIDPALWGAHVVVKSSGLQGTSSARTGLIVRTSALRTPDRLPEEVTSLLAGPETLIQEFVPTGAHPTSIRVGTFLGAVIHMMSKSSGMVLPDIFAPDFLCTIGDSNAEDASAKQHGARKLFFDPEAAHLGRRISEVFEGLPLLGIDVLRHEKTGKLFALEVNPGGNTWQFSSHHAASGREVIGKQDRVRQFDAWNTCARRLAEVCHAQAA